MFDLLLTNLEDWYWGRFGFGARSSQWRAVRNAWIEQHPVCAVCGYTKYLNVHHIKPFHLFPDLELSFANLITLGEACPTGNHHLLFGHLGYWSSWNEDVVKDAQTFRIKIQTRPLREVA